MTSVLGESLTVRCAVAISVRPDIADGSSCVRRWRQEGYLRLNLLTGMHACCKTRHPSSGVSKHAAL